MADDSAQDTRPHVPPHFQRPHREAGQLELGIVEAAEPHVGTQVVQAAGLSESALRRRWETVKPQWLAAGLAEAIGTWFYCISGMMATATMVLSQGTQGSLLQVGFAYGFGIAFAIITCATTSGGHFNPCVTISQVIFKGFPLWKAPIYIFWQILGAFVAALMVFSMYHDEMRAMEHELIAIGKQPQIFSPAGPAGIVALYPTPGRSLGSIFATEFFGDFVIAFVIWTNLDATNPFVHPSIAPYTIGLVYSVIVWGWAYGNIATNSARDVGARLAAGVIFGRDAFPARYSALTALTNIAATLAAVTIYTFILSDTRRPPAAVAHQHMEAEARELHRIATTHHDELLDRKLSRRSGNNTKDADINRGSTVTNEKSSV